MPTPRFFIYCRKSSEAEDRQVLSIESQVRELKELAAKLGLAIAEVCSESKSAKEPGRSVFNAMMQRLSRREAEGIICWKLDRLARNPVDGGSVIWAIKQNGIRVITPAQSYAREDENVILMYIEFGMAQKYVDDLSKNVKRGLKTKIENGWYAGVAPAGYLNNTARDTGENNLIIDPDRFPLIRRMWDLMLSGLYTPPRILEIANDEWGFRTRPTRRMGGKPLCKSAIYQIFTKPFYYGSFEYPKGSGRWYRGKHQPLITEAEYDRVQLLLGRNGNPRPKVNFDFPFTGLIRCGDCGCMVTAEEKHQLICGDCRFKFAYRNREDCPRCHMRIASMINPVFLHYTYYHCTRNGKLSCAQRSITAQELERQVDGHLARIEISPRFKNWAIEYLRVLHQNEMAFRNSRIETERQAYQECIRRIDNLVSLKTSPHNAGGILISDEEYSRQRIKLLNEKERYEELLQDSGHRVTEWVKLAEQTFNFACTARNLFRTADSKTKKEIVLTFGSNLVLRDKILSVEAKKPFLILRESLSSEEIKTEPIEPANDGTTKGSNVARNTKSLSLLGGLDDVRIFRYKASRAAALIYAHFKKEFGMLHENTFLGN